MENSNNQITNHKLGFCHPEAIFAEGSAFQKQILLPPLAGSE